MSNTAQSFKQKADRMYLQGNVAINSRTVMKNLKRYHTTAGCKKCRQIITKEQDRMNEKVKKYSKKLTSLRNNTHSNIHKSYKQSPGTFFAPVKQLTWHGIQKLKHPEITMTTHRAIRKVNTAHLSQDAKNKMKNVSSNDPRHGGASGGGASGGASGRASGGGRSSGRGSGSMSGGGGPGGSKVPGLRKP
tara:strand:- start:1058 stop:1627 length:570 start_codon:yes stop_codon:yes gene_type:complete